MHFKPSPCLPRTIQVANCSESRGRRADTSQCESKEPRSVFCRRVNFPRRSGVVASLGQRSVEPASDPSTPCRCVYGTRGTSDESSRRRSKRASGPTACENGCPFSTPSVPCTPRKPPASGSRTFVNHILGYGTAERTKLMRTGPHFDSGRSGGLPSKSLPRRVLPAVRSSSYRRSRTDGR